MQRLTVAGRGNVGRSLARGLHARLVPARVGFRVPRAGILFLAVPDGAVREMAARVAAMGPPAELAVVHCSGALGLDALDVLRQNPRGSFHPLQSFPAPRDPSAFRGITIAVDATTPSLERRLAAIARSLGARPRHVGDAERVVYHAAAVFASNFVDVVVAEAVALLQGIGWSEKESLAALVPLVEGAVSNIRRRGPIKALTGPIRRGDAETVSRHLAVMDNPELYRMLALVALEIAQQAGLEPAATERTRRALTRDVAATQRRRGR
ncbi:MAG TPA: DUF2520 domain-containing protein [Candidatus Dormibacteraeota bacterium]|nr:DUF2520 domain-containing protein [Candidatus Dormibacteraeota bacterium]